MSSLIAIEQLVGVERLYVLIHYGLLTLCIKIYEWTGYVPSELEVIAVAVLVIVTWIWWEYRQWPKSKN